MIYLTQLIYIEPGQEGTFDRFEAVAIPIIARHNGKLLLRVRPDESAYVEAAIERPYEIHLVSFESEADFEAFGADEERRRHLHLKEQSVRLVTLIKGVEV